MYEKKDKEAEEELRAHSAQRAGPEKDVSLLRPRAKELAQSVSRLARQLVRGDCTSDPEYAVA